MEERGGWERGERVMRGKVPQSPLPLLPPLLLLFEPHRVEREGVVTLARAPPGRIQLTVQREVPKNTFRLLD